jgi:serine/threonine-protein kinase
MSNLIGQSLGRYHILQQLGEGGMATVYKAHDVSLNRDVAVKVIRTDIFGPAVLQRLSERFKREGQALAKLTHPNIVTVLEYGEHNSVPYLVMPYLPGGTLKSRVKKPIPYLDAVRLLMPIAQALAHAHDLGIIHRDVKPANILITRTGEPLLSDFGIAKLLDTEETRELTGTGVGIGTPEYMAPEQGMGQADERADIYALGIVFYELVTGRIPYRADTPMAILIKKREEPLPRPKMFIPSLPDSVENILIKALARDPRNRYQTAREFANALDRLSRGETVTQETKKPSTPNSALLWTVVALRGLIVATICIFTGFALRGTLPVSSQTEISTTPAFFSPSTATDSATTFTPPIVFIASPASEQVDSIPMSTATVAPLDMVQIPAGEFIMGGVDGEAEDDEIPQHVVYLDSFWIDRTEVTVAKYNQCVETGYCYLNNYQSTEISTDYYTNPFYSNYPILDVSWKNASDYCSWVGKRLPTEAEWEKAARGTNGQVFPWGDQSPQSNHANMCDSNCLLEFANTGINDGYTSLAPVGSYPNGASPYGLMDMAGNVWEWTADWYDVNYYRNSPSNNPT